jgi:type I restriction enzyme S subunit
MMYQKAIHRVRFLGGYQQRLLVFFLEFLAKTGRLERWFTGSTIKHFTRESFAQLPVPLVPQNEQTRIVTEVDRRLSLIRETDSQVDANLLRAERLRQSILGKAFSGGFGVNNVDTFTFARHSNGARAR